MLSLVYDLWHYIDLVASVWFLSAIGWHLPQFGYVNNSITNANRKQHWFGFTVFNGSYLERLAGSIASSIRLRVASWQEAGRQMRVNQSASVRKSVLPRIEKHNGPRGYARDGNNFNYYRVFLRL
jgi:hypothetical protein